MRSGDVRALGVCVAYLAATLFLTWPLGASLATQLPHPIYTARGDVPLVAWVLAHASRALVPWGDAPGGIYHPTPWSLFYGETAFGALPQFAPVFLATGNPTLAINVLFLSGVALTAAAVHAVAQHWSRSHLAGLVAGATFLATPWTLWGWVPSAPNYAALQYMPFVLVLAARGPTGWASTAGLATLIVLQGLASAYVAAAMLAPLGVLAAARLLRTASRPAGLRVVAALALATAAFVAVWYGHVLVQRANPLLGKQSVFAGMGFVRTQLPDQVFHSYRPAALTVVAWGVIVFGGLRHLVALRQRTATPANAAAWKHCGLWLLVGLYLSLGPYVAWEGRTYRLPHAGLSPLLSALRSQDRFGIATLIAGSILAGVAFAQCATLLPIRGRRVGSAAFAAIVLAATYASYLRPIAPLLRTLDPAAPYPTLKASVLGAPMLAALAGSRGPLLEVPIGPTIVPHATAMYGAIHHRRPLLNGYHGYWPAEFPARMALACRLPDETALDELRRTTGVEHILVHLATLYAARHTAWRPPYGCAPDPRWDAAPRGGEIQAWLQPPPGLELVARDGNDALFRVVPPTTEPQAPSSQR